MKVPFHQTMFSPAVTARSLTTSMTKLPARSCKVNLPRPSLGTEKVSSIALPGRIASDRGEMDIAVPSARTGVTGMRGSSISASSRHSSLRIRDSLLVIASDRFIIPQK